MSAIDRAARWARDELATTCPVASPTKHEALTVIVGALNGLPAIREDPWTCCETHTADCPDPACPARQ